MDSIFYKDGNIRWQVAVVKSLASALSIGTGAAVGREGPIIQIGAALGSAFSQAIRLAPWQKVTLLSAGAGAGIAATFNTPLGGVLFALEILLPEVSNRTFLPVVIATGAATQVGRMLIGPDPAFKVPEIQFPPAAILQRPGGARLRAARRALRPRLLGLHPPAGGDGGRLSEAARRRLCAEHRRHGGHRPDDGRPHPRVRPFLRRRRRLRRHPVGAGRPDDRRGAAGAAVRPQAPRHDGQPRLRGLGRHFLAVALSRRDARRRRSPRRSASPCRMRASPCHRRRSSAWRRWSAPERAAS